MRQENKYIRSLVKNARLGKLVALEELYEINLNHIYTLILRLSGNKSLADLITKNTLVTAWEEIKENGPDDLTFLEWLKNIAVKVAINELMSSPDPGRNKNTKDDPPGGSSPEGLEQVIADLDDESRIILVLNKMENRTFVNISRLLRKPESDIEEKLSDAITRISNSITKAESSTNINDLSTSIPDESEADIEVLQSALDEIMEIRFEEIQESKDELGAKELEEFRQYEEKKKEERRKESLIKKKRKKVSKRFKTSKFNNKVFLRIALPVFIVVFAIYTFTSTESWKVRSNSGVPLLNNKSFSQSVNITPGDLITVGESSNAVIEMSEIGKIEVLSGTSVERLEKDNTFKLLTGKLLVNDVESKDKLTIIVPDGTIKDYSDGTKYTVQVDKRGNSTIELQTGWLEVVSGHNVAIFPSQYSLSILKGGGVCVPYYSKFESDFKKLLEEYIFNGKKGMTLNKIIKLSTQKESIMLWNLLQRVKPKHRSLVYDKLDELVPHPSSMEKKDLLNLDPDLLRGWLDEIGWLL